MFLIAFAFFAFIAFVPAPHDDDDNVKLIDGPNF